MSDTWQHGGAFVLQFRPGTDVAAGRFEGRVTHVASAREARFHSLAELLTFLAQVLQDVPDEAARPDHPGVGGR